MNLKNNPKISIVSISYNHEKYISNFIQSVLNQTFDNFELIIIDDASTDNNLKIAKSFNDPRIKIIEHKYNMGPSIGLNDGIKLSVGEYVSIIATDDELTPKYLEKGINFLDKNNKYGALCFQLTAIDDTGKTIDDKNLQQTLKFKNIEYFHLLQKMFFEGNMIPSPGEIIRKSIIGKIGSFNNALLQTQDYDYHVKTLLKYPIHVYQEPLIRYRRTSTGQNIDNSNSNSILRQNLEIPFILDNYLNINCQQFKNIFNDLISPYGKPDPKTIPYFLAILAINSPNNIRQKWGYATLLKFINIKENIELLQKLYSISFKDLTILINKIISPEEVKSQQSEKLKKELYTAQQYIKKIQNSKIYKLRKKINSFFK